MGTPLYPSLYQINTRVWLAEVGRRQGLGRAATFDDVPEESLAQIAGLGFDWAWFLGVWQTGEVGRRIALAIPELRDEYRRALPDFTDADVCGSPFAVSAYQVHADFGGEPALSRFRERLRKHGLRLMLDFMPNHTALDHLWAYDRPEFYIQGDAASLARTPRNFCRIETRHGPLVLAHGRDPNYDGWSDTLQLNYRHAAFRQAMIAELKRISERCDGVRCDMAMLILPEVIRGTWGDLSIPRDGTSPVDAPFWPEAISEIHAQAPDFLFMAEVYWDLEWTLQQQGFGATYDKRLYDRLHRQDAGGVRGHLLADLEFQRKSVRFLENHDEPRAASAFPQEIHPAAAVLTCLIPGLRFFHEGQLDGRRVKIPIQLCRRPEEAVDRNVRDFYEKLLMCLKRPEVRDGAWQLLECRAAWEGNPTANHFIAGLWTGSQRERLLVVVNYSPAQGQCFVPLPIPEFHDRQVVLHDLLSPARYERDGNDLSARGLYLDLGAWGYHAFGM